MLYRSVLLGLIFFVCAGSLPAQPPDVPIRPPTGLSIQGGLGQYALRDEYISKERYAGTLPLISAEWSRFHGKWGYRMGFEFSQSADIRNNNVATEIFQAVLYRDYIYPVGRKSLFGKDAYLFLGPSTGIRLYTNDQKIANQGAFDIDYSTVTLISLGMNAMVVVPVRSRLQAEGSLRLSLLAMGVRSMDVVEGEGSMGGILTLFSGTDPTAECGIRYFILDKLSLKAAYKLQVLRIGKWNPLLSVSDNITLTASYHL
ncbi:MAG: hypothetical protein JSW54_10790 [Fidelibacterota bacterium]|nr:MAG: hypothetical protein JSW54_10790 [Candidatus Neomarinimicrobiota bacterium]